MDTRPSRHIHKYFASSDVFVRVRLADPTRLGSLEEMGLVSDSQLDGASFKRAVVQCFIDFGAESAPHEQELHATASALEELYQLVVDVNPALDISTVRLSSPEAVRTSAHGASNRNDRRRKLRSFATRVEERLGRRIFGQERALASVARAVQHAALGWRERGPLAALLFVGPTGTGKTELARSLATELGGDASLLRVDCTEYAEGHEYAKLLGAPPGYVGHAAGGFLSRAFDEAPPSVVLFDEIEKADEQMQHLLLQIMDEGYLTDGHGRRLDFRNVLVVLTSNAGSADLAALAGRIGFGNGAPDPAAREDVVDAALRTSFRPEFIGRLDEVVLFDDLELAAGVRIAEERLGFVASRVRRGGRRVRFSGRLARWIAERGLGQGSGARGILHAIRREIEAPLAERLLASPAGGWVVVSLRGQKPRFRHTAD